MKLLNNKVALAVCVLMGTMGVNAQNVKTEKSVANRHTIRLTYSDGLTLGGASFWGMGLADVVTGTQRSDQQSTGVFGIGYRYAAKRWLKVGMDLGFAQVQSKLTSAPDNVPSIREKELNLLVLPTAEFVYFKRNLFELYGSAAVGVDLSRRYETGLTNHGKQIAKENSNLEVGFVNQVNPIGLRVGNNRIGGFVEAGLGYRGFITAGITLGF